jgi:hypothetical protein
MNVIKQNLDTYLGKLYMIHDIILDYNGYYHNEDMKKIKNLGDMIDYNEMVWNKYNRNINIERLEKNLLFIKKNIIILTKLNKLNINMLNRIGGSCCNFIRNRMLNEYIYDNNIYIDNNSIYSVYGHFIITTDEIKYNIYNLYKEFSKIYKNIKIDIERDMYYDNMTIALKLPYNIILYPNHNILKKYINEIIF